MADTGVLGFYQVALTFDLPLQLRVDICVHPPLVVQSWYRIPIRFRCEFTSQHQGRAAEGEPNQIDHLGPRASNDRPSVAAAFDRCRARPTFQRTSALRGCAYALAVTSVEWRPQRPRPRPPRRCRCAPWPCNLWIWKAMKKTKNKKNTHYWEKHSDVIPRPMIVGVHQRPSYRPFSD